MNPRPSIFILQIIVVSCITAFHVAAARLAWGRLWAGRPRERSGAVLLAVLVLMLDLPLVHSFVFYKFYHPLFLDQLMHDLAMPFIALHANAALFGGALVLRDGLLPRLRRAVARLRRDRRGNAEVKSPTLPAAASAVPVSPDSSAVPAPSVIPAVPLHSAGISRRSFIARSGMALAGVATNVTMLSAMGSTDDYRIERAVIRIPNLPESLKGTSIALISDVHSSVFMTREEMDRYVAALNGLKADIAVVAGDFVNSKLREVYPFAEAFSALEAPLGVYGVTGNHDYYTGEIEAVAREVGQSGIRLLRNENIAIEKNGERLWLLGMDDADIYDVKPYLETGASPKGTIENMLRGIPQGAPRVFLCHKPYPFEEYSRLGVDLMLSGHTHGGQVVIAQLDNVNLSFATLASRYVAGLYRARTNRSQLYVSRGVGTVGLPLRLNCPPEITHIILV